MRRWLAGEDSSRMHTRNGHKEAPGGSNGGQAHIREQLSIFGGSPAESDDRLTSIDLFAGAGGIAEGLRQAGFECLYANDFDRFALDTFELNHPSTRVEHSPIEDVDAREVRIKLGVAKGDLDCLAGGPPCQGFSINAPERFLDDPRNSLFKHYLRLCR